MCRGEGGWGGAENRVFRYSPILSFTVSRFSCKLVSLFSMHTFSYFHHEFTTVSLVSLRKISIVKSLHYFCKVFIKL